MRTKVAFALLFTTLAALGRAQTTVTLVFPSDGERVVWSGKGIPDAVPTDATVTKKRSEGIIVTEGATRLFVLDKTTGNIASTDVEKVADKGWNLAPASFTHIGEVSVKVENQAQPVAAARVSLKDAARTQSQLLDPSTKGAAKFHFVKPGTVTVIVEYRSGGQDATPVKQQFDLKLQRDEVAPNLLVSVPGAVEHAGVAAPAQDGTPGQEAAQEKNGANPVGTILVYVIGLAIAVALGFFLMQYAKKNPDVVGAKLEQLGVQIPKPQDEPLTDPGPAPMPVKPAAPEKIMLGDSEPDLPVAVAPSSGVNPQPRMTGPAGVVHLSEGETVVGREGAAGFGLEAESTVSRRHARLMREGTEVKVSDLGSTNGTFVNGIQVQTETTLRPGDEVRFGTVAFRYEV